MPHASPQLLKVCDCCLHRCCDERKLGIEGRRNELARPDYKFEVLLRAHFHRSETDESGEHNTTWVSLESLKGLEGEEEKVKEIMQQFVDVAFLTCKYDFDVAAPVHV